MTTAATYPNWLTVQEWVTSVYSSDYSREFLDGLVSKGCSNYSYGPIFPALQIMLRVKEGFSYQPFRHKETGTNWIRCTVTDYSYAGKLQSKLVLKAQEIQYHKYRTYLWPNGALELAGIDLKGRHKLTHLEIQKLTHVPQDDPHFSERLRFLTLWNEQIDKRMGSLSWYKEAPHIECPVKTYVDGCGDSSYTEVLPSLEVALAKVEKWKIDPPEEPWEGSVFTN